MIRVAVILGQDEQSEFAEPGIQFCGFIGWDSQYIRNDA